LAFARPGAKQKRPVLDLRLAPLGISLAHSEGLVAATGLYADHHVGFTKSDLLIPVVLDAFPHRAVESDRVITIARDIRPTPAFNDRY